MLHPAAVIEPRRKKQSWPEAPHSGDELMPAQIPCALCSPEPVFAKDSLRLSEGAHGLVSFGVSDDDEDAMSTAVSEREDWSRSPVPELMAPLSEASEHVAPTGDDELLRVLTKAVEAVA